MPDPEDLLQLSFGPQPRDYLIFLAVNYLITWTLVAVVLTLTGHLTDNLAWRRAAPGLGVLMTWPLVKEPYGNLRVWALLMALLSLSMGAQVLRRFMREHPIVEERTPDVG